MSRDQQADAPSVFLCYAREDFERVFALYALLKRLGLRPWLDKYDITGGELWQPAIEKAVRGADFFIASFSNASVRKSGFVQREYRFALDALAERPPGSIFVIPVRLDDCELPDLRGTGVKLSDIQWVDLFQEAPLTENDIEPILKAIEAQSGWQRPPVELSEIAEEYGGRLDPLILESMRVRELPYTDAILTLEAQTDQTQLRRLEEEAFRLYLSVGLPEARGLGCESFYLIARYLYRAILADDPAVCRHRPFIYPVHQYLSKMIRAAPGPERRRLLANLRRWLGSKDTYQTSRDFAAFELGMSKAREEKGALLEALDDPFELPLVRYYAAMALGMIGSRESLGRLVEIYHREPDAEIRKVIAHSILHIGGGAG